MFGIGHLTTAHYVFCFKTNRVTHSKHGLTNIQILPLKHYLVLNYLLYVLIKSQYNFNEPMNFVCVSRKHSPILFSMPSTNKNKKNNIMQYSSLSNDGIHSM